jgi:hypothetical protein
MARRAVLGLGVRMNSKFRVGDRVRVEGSSVYKGGVNTPNCWMVDRVYFDDEDFVWRYNLSHGEGSGGSGYSGITGATGEGMQLWSGKRENPDWDEEAV